MVYVVTILRLLGASPPHDKNPNHGSHSEEWLSRLSEYV